MLTHYLLVLRRLLGVRLELDIVEVSRLVVGIGSGSSGVGGGVVSIVQPIHPEITRTNKTKSRTGIPTAQSCQ
jgi:hypothetical protein